MKCVTDRETYDAVAKGEPLVIERRGRKVTINAAVKVTDANGDTELLDSWEYRAGCPVRIGHIVTLRFRDGGKARGRLAVIVSATQLLDNGRWLIRLERAGTRHRPIPADDRNYFLAPTNGYTGNPARALDPDAPTMDVDEAMRVVRDTQIRETAAKSRVKLPPPPESPLDDDAKADVIAKIADELAA